MDRPSYIPDMDSSCLFMSASRKGFQYTSYLSQMFNEIKLTIENIGLALQIVQTVLGWS